jgi:hypothetical protein
MPVVTSKNLQVRLFILVILAFIPALGFYWYANRELRDFQTIAKEEELLQRVRAVSSEYRHLTEDTRAFLGTLSEIPAIREGSFPECGELLEDILPHIPRFTTISVIGVDGYMTCGSLAPDEDLYLGDRAYFVRANAVRDFVVGEFALGRITGKAVLGMALPVVDEGEVQRVLAASLELETLAVEWGRTPLPEGHTFTILDSTGRIMARRPRTGDFTLADTVGARTGEGFPGMPEGREAGLVTGTDIDGVERVFAVAPLQGVAGNAQGYAVAGRPRATFLQEAEHVSEMQLRYMALGGLLLLILAWVLGHFWLVKGAGSPRQG